MSIDFSTRLAVIRKTNINGKNVELLQLIIIVCSSHWHHREKTYASNCFSPLQSGVIKSLLMKTLITLSFYNCGSIDLAVFNCCRSKHYHLGSHAV